MEKQSDSENKIKIVGPVKLKLSELVSNAHRDKEHYSIDQASVDRIKKSLQRTGFWTNVPIRKKNGHYEFPHGEHRLEAMKQLYGENFETTFLLCEYDDDASFDMMALEALYAEHTPSPSKVNATIRDARDYLLANPDVVRSIYFNGAKEVITQVMDRLEREKSIGAETIHKFFSEVYGAETVSLSRIREALREVRLIEEDQLSEDAVKECNTQAESKQLADFIEKHKTPVKDQKELVADIKQKKSRKKLWKRKGKRNIISTIPIEEVIETVLHCISDLEKFKPKKDEWTSDDKWKGLNSRMRELRTLIDEIVPQN